MGFTIGGVRVGGTAVVQGTDADKLKKVKMDKSYAHLISDIPGAFSLLPLISMDGKKDRRRGLTREERAQAATRSKRTSTSSTSS